MSPDSIYTLINAIAAVAWLLLAAMPRVKAVTSTIAGVVVPAFFSIAYLLLVATTFWRADGSFATLSGVAQLFQNPWLLLAGWLHYLAFDLLIGSWEVRDARERGIPHLLVLPCLFLTFMFGPVGWLLYRGIRAARSGAAATAR